MDKAELLTRGNIKDVNRKLVKADLISSKGPTLRTNDALSTTGTPTGKIVRVSEVVAGMPHNIRALSVGSPTPDASKAQREKGLESEDQLPMAEKAGPLKGTLRGKDGSGSDSPPPANKFWTA